MTGPTSAVADHGDAITVESAPGQGSTFTVWLPRADAAAEEPAAESGRRAEKAPAGLLMLVEDEAALRRAGQRMLERLGYTVLAAESGPAALRLAEGLDGIDLLVSDVVLPGMDGPEVAEQLRRRWPDLRVLYVTGYSDDRLTRTGALREGDRVLLKPYGGGQLSQALSEMLGRGRAAGSTNLAPPARP